MNAKNLVVCSGALYYYIRRVSSGWLVIWELSNMRSGTSGVYPTAELARTACYQLCSP